MPFQFRVFQIFALQCGYFLVPWNVYDFGVAIISILYVHFPGLAETYFVSPNLLRLVRVAIVGRVLRLIKGPTGIRALFLTLELSIPGLLNICLFLVLIMFIYAIFGMSLFMNIELRSGLDVVFNFRTFGQSMILLFQLSTTAGESVTILAFLTLPFANDYFLRIHHRLGSCVGRAYKSR